VLIRWLRSRSEIGQVRDGPSFATNAGHRRSMARSKPHRLSDFETLGAFASPPHLGLVPVVPLIENWSGRP
jgi:hypothetical protein